MRKKHIKQYNPEKPGDAFDTNIPESERLFLRLVSLKYQMEKYYHADIADATYSFGHFLKEYADAIDRTRRTLAAEIGIDESMLSQLINQHRTPPDYIAIRLELHSNNTVPAEYWYKVVQKDWQKEMSKNKSIMIKRQRKYVTGNIEKRKE